MNITLVTSYDLDIVHCVYMDGCWDKISSYYNISGFKWSNNDSIIVYRNYFDDNIQQK